MLYQSYSNILIKHRQSANFEPDDIGKSYVPQKKALNSFLDIYLYLGLSFEVYNSFLCHLAQKWQVVYVWWEYWNVTGKTFWSLSFLKVGLHMHTVPQNRDKFTINNLSYCCKALTFTHSCDPFKGVTLYALHFGPLPWNVEDRTFQSLSI